MISISPNCPPKEMRVASSATGSISSSTNKEIEVKIRLTPAEKYEVELWLFTHAKHNGCINQKDLYLDNPSSSYCFTNQQGLRDADKYLRVRTSDEKSTLCYKQVHRNSDTGECLYCDEYETVINDPESMLRILQAAGYTEITKVTKVRQEYAWGSFEIALDDVEDIGLFLEVELKEKANDSESGLKAIKDFIREEMGIQVFKQQSHGYTTMAWNPGLNFEL